MQSDVTTGGTITSVWFKYDGYTTVYGTLNIYLGHTSKSQFNTNSDWVDPATLQLVKMGRTKPLLGLAGMNIYSTHLLQWD